MKEIEWTIRTLENVKAASFCFSATYTPALVAEIPTDRTGGVAKDWTCAVIVPFTPY